MPIPLDEFYDQLAVHDWHYVRTEDPTAFKKGKENADRLRALCDTSPEHRQLYLAFHNSVLRRETDRPPRPVVGL